MDLQQRLQQIDEVIAQGPFTDTWESLCAYEVPAWYKNAKFGIFIHWGVYAVPAFGSEWYPRNMYKKGSKEYEHHLKTYGAHKDFGYKDFIPMFKAEKFDPAKWAELFKKSGARYVMPVAEHHDGFQMYDSEISDFNAKKMGPCRDLLGELKTEIEKQGMVFTASDHRAEHCWFFNQAKAYESDVNDPANQEFYWNPEDVDFDTTHDVETLQPSKEHCEDWLARICELVDKYRPKIIFFDWWIHNLGFKPYLKKFAAYYYNRAAEWGTTAAINYKYHAYAHGSAVLDIERGQLNTIRPMLWQTDTSIAKNSWGYTENNDFKPARSIICDLIDIVSKNGCLLLNIGPRADGTITDEETAVLLEIGEWMEKNGEGIYDTTYWETFGEGPTEILAGAFTDVERADFTEEDFRYTFAKSNLYAFAMTYPKDGKLTMKSLAKLRVDLTHDGDFAVKGVSILGYDNAVSYTRDYDGLHLTVEGTIDTNKPVCFKIAID